MKIVTALCIIPGILIMLLSCSSTTGDQRIINHLEKPDEVRIFSVPANSLTRELSDNRPNAVKGFPFISFQPAMQFKGKFSPEFYSRFARGWRAESIKDADFWSLKSNPGLYDVIYVMPLWAGELKIGGKDLLENIARSYNIPVEQLKILEDWVKGGGILWMESVINVSAYDFKLNKLDDAGTGKLEGKLRHMSIYNHKLNLLVLKAAKTDQFNVEKLTHEITFDASQQPGQVKEINDVTRSLLLEQTDYIGMYCTIDGTPIIKDKKHVLASYADHGKGKIITLAPFDFRNAYQDGELFRLTLLSWALGNKK